MGMSKDRLAASAGVAAVTVALSLAVLKFLALQATGSLTVAASLADSAIDAVASMTGLAAILYASRPADEDHAFGHGSAEDLAALGQAALILVSAAAIAWGAVSRLAAPTPAALAEEGFGMAVMGVSIVMTLALLGWQRHVARVTGSRVVAADALHYLSDLLPNIGAVAALAASRWYDLPWVDSALGLLAAAILARGAAKIARGAWDALMDRGADAATQARLHDIAAHHPGLIGYHDLKTRTAGRRLFVQIHVELDGGLSLHEAHDIGAGLRHKMLDAFPDAEVIVHKDPA